MLDNEESRGTEDSGSGNELAQKDTGKDKKRQNPKRSHQESDKPGRNACGQDQTTETDVVRACTPYGKHKITCKNPIWIWGVKQE